MINNAIKIMAISMPQVPTPALGIGTGGGGSSYNMVSDWSQYVAGSELWVVSAELINALRTSVTGHIGDSTHASAGEKSHWNAAYSHSLVTGGVHMTSTDRSKLDGIEAQANKYIHPTKTSTLRWWCKSFHYRLHLRHPGSCDGHHHSSHGQS